METLVLDMSYMPVAKVNWQRAVTLLFLGKVEVIEEYEDREIKSVTFSIKMPSIVRFIKAFGSKKKAIKFTRENVLARDNSKCQYCGTTVERYKSTYDHVVPRAQGGKTIWENVVIACMDCNQKKGSKTPEQAGMKLLSKPVRPKKLPPHAKISQMWKKGEPEAWKTFLRDVVASYKYWNDELEQG